MPKFSIEAYNGGKLSLKGIPLPVIVDLGGMEYADSIVANLDHDDKRRVGHVTEKSNDGRKLTLDGIVSAATSDATEVVQSAARDFPWQASIEAKILGSLEEIKAGKPVRVNGQDFHGPVYVARKTQLFGVALLTRGADSTTSVTIAATATEKEMMNAELKTWIEAETAFDPDTLDAPQTAWLTKQFEASQVKPVVKAKTTEEQTLATLLEDQKTKREQVKQITEITAAAINDYPEAIDAIKTVAEMAIEASWTKDRFELEMLRVTRPQASATISRRKDPKMNSKVLEAAICEYGNLETLEKDFDDQTLQAAHDRFPQGIGLQQLILMAARDNGHDDRYASQVNIDIQRAAFRMQGAAGNQGGWIFDNQLAEHPQQHGK